MEMGDLHLVELMDGLAKLILHVANAAMRWSASMPRVMMTIELEKAVLEDDSQDHRISYRFSG